MVGDKAMQEPKQETFRPIKGKVAKILNDRELAINRGADQGVSVGTLFKVMDPEELVLDPDTEEELGLIEREKIRVKVFLVQDNICVARTYETYRTHAGALSLDFGFSQLFSSSQTKVRTLRASEYPSNPIDEAESFVSIGDIVVELDPNEE